MVDARGIEQESALSRLADRIETWWRSKVEDADFAGLAPDEVARVAHDIGLSANDFERLARRETEEDLLLYRRLLALGIKVEDLKEKGFLRDLQRTCAMCESTGICRHDLDARPDAPGWTAYCGNSSVLTQITPTETDCAGSAPGKSCCCKS